MAYKPGVSHTHTELTQKNWNKIAKVSFVVVVLTEQKYTDFSLSLSVSLCVETVSLSLSIIFFHFCEPLTQRGGFYVRAR